MYCFCLSYFHCLAYCGNQYKQWQNLATNFNIVCQSFIPSLKSRDAFKSCLNMVREQDSKSLQALEAMPDIIPADPPLQPVNDAESLWRDAKEAERKIKNVVGPGTAWLDENPGWVLLEDDSVEWLEKATDPSIKSQKSGTEKFMYKYKGKFNRLRDVSRMAF